MNPNKKRASNRRDNNRSRSRDYSRNRSRNYNHDHNRNHNLYLHDYVKINYCDDDRTVFYHDDVRFDVEALDELETLYKNNDFKKIEEI